MGEARSKARTYVSITFSKNRLIGGIRPDGAAQRSDPTDEEGLQLRLVANFPVERKRPLTSFRAFPLFFESRKRSILLFPNAFRTENRRALFLEML
ncbi:hypothetical protein, partial [Rhizobium freirei]|uniref:hypothetical protein n=1 Tax=Rhizobium freirei TaxID=1353277 RepID=UPI001AEBC6A8